MIIQISLIFGIVLNDIIVKNTDKYSKMLISNNDRYLSILISEVITMYRYLLVIDRTFATFVNILIQMKTKLNLMKIKNLTKLDKNVTF